VAQTEGEPPTKGELSCGESLYIDGQVEGTIDPKGNRLTIGPHGRVKANVIACSVVVQGKLDGNVQASDRIRSSPVRPEVDVT